jgi:hypothetical protein
VRAVGHDLVGEAPGVGLGGVDDASGQDQLEGTPHAHDEGESLRATVDQWHAPAALGIAEPAARRGDP